MAPGPAGEPQGDSALNPGFMKIVGVLEVFIAVVTPVLVANAALVASGLTSGDLGLRLLDSAHLLLLCAVALAGRSGAVSRHTEIVASLMILTILLTVTMSYVLLSTEQGDLIEVFAGLPLAMCIIASVDVSCRVSGVTGLRAGAQYFAIGVVAFAAIVRGFYDVEARAMLQTFVLGVVPPCSGVTWMIRSFGIALHDAQQNLQQECRAKEEALRSLSDSQVALSRVLKALCNVVMEVDAELRLQSPSWQVHDMLGSGTPTGPDQLHGRSLLDFIATDEAAANLRSFMQGEVQQATVHREHDQRGPASVFSVEMKDSEGVRFTAQLYHACLMGDGRNPSHLLGVCLPQDPAAQRAPPLLNDMDFNVPWNEFLATPLQILALRPRLQRAASRSSGSHTEGAASADPSRIAICFDAGTPTFEVTRGSVLIGPLKRGRRVGVLDLLDQAAIPMLERWVVDEIHDHQAATTRGQAFQPTPFPNQLTLKLPRSRLVVQPAEVWVQSHDARGDEEIPVTLWLRRFRVLNRGQALAAVSEQDVDVVSESSDDIAAERQTRPAEDRGLFDQDVDLLSESSDDLTADTADNAS